MAYSHNLKSRARVWTLGGGVVDEVWNSPLNRLWKSLLKLLRNDGLAGSVAYASTLVLGSTGVVESVWDGVFDGARELLLELVWDDGAASSVGLVGGGGVLAGLSGVAGGGRHSDCVVGGG